VSDAPLELLVCTLDELTNDLLVTHPVWCGTGVYNDDGLQYYTPVPLTHEGLVPANVGEVFCLSKCHFADGAPHLACAMCHGDSPEGPLLLTVWNGGRPISLILPPAPDFVLQKEGPEAFASAFGLPASAVFPAIFEVVPEFATPPRRRRVKLTPTGAEVL
jgi:hypothetical protein